MLGVCLESPFTRMISTLKYKLTPRDIKVDEMLVLGSDFTMGELGNGASSKR